MLDISVTHRSAHPLFSAPARRPTEVPREWWMYVRRKVLTAVHKKRLQMGVEHVMRFRKGKPDD